MPLLLEKGAASPARLKLILGGGSPLPIRFLDTLLRSVYEVGLSAS